LSSENLAREVRELCLRLCHKHRASHIGGAYSVADILAVLYQDILEFHPEDAGWEGRDRLFYSKGHACTALYAVLEKKGFFQNLLEEFSVDGTYFTSHVNHHIPGVELSTGSLGHALGVACGTALAGKTLGKSWKSFAILSDGELDEGSNWEAFLFAPQQKLTNLCAVIDYNKIQSFGRIAEVLDLEPLADKLRAFRWQCLEVDGHDHQALRQALGDFKTGKTPGPLALVCHTIKGKGVSFMENQLAWHYKSPNDAQLEQGLKELAAHA